MIGSFSNPWFWAPMLGGFILAVIFMAAAYYYNAEQCPRTIPEKFFSDNPIRSLALAGGGTALSLVPIILSDEIRKDAMSLSLMSASTLMFLLSMLVGLWLYAGTRSLPSPSANAVTIQTPFWIALQGGIFAFLVTAILTFGIFVLFSPALAPPCKL